MTIVVAASTSAAVIAQDDQPSEENKAAGSVPRERPPIRPASALHGWADWERGKKIFEKVKVPPAPPLSPEEELATFRVAPGYRVELVASEPMVANPIFFEFDEDGRIWALEYRGYMRDLQGRGEGDPICRLVVLEDTDEDGKADKSTVFLDGLVMPRSFAFVEGGVLVAEPPHLWFCRDTDGDLQCDEKRKVGNYGIAGNPQHTANGLRRGIDNWLHSADWSKRHRFHKGKLIEEDAIHRGQFGVSFDDTGRYFTCHESNAAVADFIPAEYLLRNPNLMALYRRGGNRERFGLSMQIARNAQEVFPIRPTPQITLGGLELRDDGTLRTYTVVAGTCVYRGDQFPDDARGNLFVPEAGGHLIGRLKLSGDHAFHAERFYPAKQELLASTDERFRPVNARNGPDGALYIADMYKGIIEHVIFMVPWVADQIKDRKLESGNDMGRIWRIVHEGKPVERKSPRLSSASTSKLVQTLGHSNGWWRDTAQRLLVDRNPEASVPLLRAFAIKGGSHLGRVHALWTLQGMQAIDWDTDSRALRDPHRDVRAAALRVAESLVSSKDEKASGTLQLEVADLLERGESDQGVLQQAMLSLGEAKSSPQLFGLFGRLLEKRGDALARTAVLSSLGNRELEFLQHILKSQDGKLTGDHHRELVRDLSQLVALEGNGRRVESLLISTAGSKFPIETLRVVIDGLTAFVPKDSSANHLLEFSTQPAVVATLAGSDDPGDNERGMKLRKLATWPGNTPWQAARVDVKPLTPEQITLARLGSEKYTLLCSSCHQSHGGGLSNVAPPLARSEWVNGPPARLAQVVLRGLFGPIEVRGEKWNHHMPGFGNTELLGDRDIAGILTFVRRAWGNRAEAVGPDLVKIERAASADRALPWTAAELAGKSAPGLANSAPISPADDGQVVLPAKRAQVMAQKLRYHDDLDIIGPWVIAGDAALWHIDSPAGGKYNVRLLYACDEKNAGNRFFIETDLSQLSGTIKSTGSFETFKSFGVGTIKLKKGTNRLLMHPDKDLKGELVDLRSIILVPAGG